MAELSWYCEPLRPGEGEPVHQLMADGQPTGWYIERGGRDVWCLYDLSSMSDPISMNSSLALCKATAGFMWCVMHPEGRGAD